MATTDANRDEFLQKEVMEDALRIYKQRERTRGGLWKDFGPEEDAMHMRSKAARVHAIIFNPSVPNNDALDDALDLINYAAFLVRKVRGEV